MTPTTTNPIITTANNEIVGKLTSDFFGAIGVNSYGFHYFEDHVEELGLTNIRFPGGTVSESGYVIDGRIRLGQGDISLQTLDGDRSSFAFDLTHPELISPMALLYDELHHLNRDDIATFSEALDFAIANESSLDLIIPVQRYFVGSDLSDAVVREKAIAAATSDIEVFLERLVNGEYNDGRYPEKITLEIGNEAYANPIEYALISKVMIDKIVEKLDGSGINYEIAFQMGRGSYEFNNLLGDGYFEPFFDDPSDLIYGLDQLGFVPTAGMPYLERQVAIDQVMISVLGESLAHIDALRHHYLMVSADELTNPELPVMQRGLILDHWLEAFAQLGLNPDDVDYYVSAWTTDSSNGSSTPYELITASNMLALFSHFLEIGVDRAAAWGVVGSFRFTDDMPTSVVSDRLSDFYSPTAALFQLMTDNVIDSDFLGKGGDQGSGYTSYTFEADDSFVIFVAVDRLNGLDFDLDVDLGMFGDLAQVSVANLDILDGTLSGASNTTTSIADVVDGKVTVNFDQDFEIAMIKLPKADSMNFQLAEFVDVLLGEDVSWGTDIVVETGSTGSDILTGTTSVDVIQGGDGDDLIEGGSGRAGLFSDGEVKSGFDQLAGNNGDFLFGGAGNDQIKGNAGNDFLSGDSGNDQLWGGSGFDIFVFTQGQDQIHDFTVGVDTILIAEALLEGQDIEYWAQQASSTDGNSLELDFGAGNTLTIHNLTDVNLALQSFEVLPAGELLL